MITLVFANGETIKADTTVEEFQTAIQNAAPSSWVSVQLENVGSVYLNAFIIAYYY